MSALETWHQTGSTVPLPQYLAVLKSSETPSPASRALLAIIFVSM